MARLTGEITWFDQAKGAGFIAPADGTRNVYVYRTSLRDGGAAPEVTEGVRVDFELVDGRNGPTAVDVVIL
ncbi:cold shock domain-containing protein [Streptomyces sp. NPDC049577]|uniref:cold shock domain-containing protein n=1 Tax=Streptomyces sp. NPDC049577 TaxID=3155153 RepID=UPI0034251B6A